MLLGLCIFRDASHQLSCWPCGSRARRTGRRLSSNESATSSRARQADKTRQQDAERILKLDEPGKISMAGQPARIVSSSPMT